METITIPQIIEILKFVLPTIALPILILALTNWHTRKMKTQEQKFELEKLKESKAVDSKFTIDNEKRIHEKDVYSCLLKILFEVQKLHIELSGNCVDYNCINDSVINFKSALNKYQDKISENQIYLNSKATDHLYGFYQNIGELLIELKEIQDSKQFHLAIASVYFRSQDLALKILLVHDTFNSQTTDEKKKEHYLKEYGNFINCCGTRPTAQIIKEYNSLAPVSDIVADQKQLN